MLKYRWNSNIIYKQTLLVRRMKYIYVIAIMGLLLLSGCSPKEYPELKELKPLPEITKETEEATVDTVPTETEIEETEIEM